jgi:predicted RNA-binding Zn ribbon-like protein
MSDRLPLLGETFAVELANSDHRTGHEERDFLAASDDIAAWFARAPAAAGIVVPAPLSPEVAAAVRGIRDATRLFLTETVDGHHAAARADAAELLHREARSAPGHLALDIDGARTWRLHHEGDVDDVFRAAVACRCILFLGGDDADRVQRCARPACPMLFVRRHRARRFCEDTCAHSVRQARYYRRHTSAT